MDTNLFGEKDTIVQHYLSKRANEYFKQFWANAAHQNGLTITYDGKIVLVKPEDIHVIDLGGVDGRCLCNHPIRYEFYFNKFGPIGSSCIKTMTGLSDTDLRLLLKGADLAKKDRDIFVSDMEKYGTLEKQFELDSVLKSAYETVYKEVKISPDILQFVENNIPFPQSIVREILKISLQIKREQELRSKYPAEVVDCFFIHKDVMNNVVRVCPNLVDYTANGAKYVVFTVYDIADQIRLNKASQPQIDLFVKLVRRLQHPKFLDAINVLVILKEKPEIVGEFWHKIIIENLTKAASYSLSDAQIAFILDKSSSGKPGLAVRFAQCLQPVQDNQ